MTNLTVLPRVAKEPEINASDLLADLSESTPSDTKMFVLRVLHRQLRFHTANIRIDELYLALGQAQKFILDGGLQ